MALEFNADKEILKSNSLKIKNDTSLNLRLGGGADEKSALFSQLSNDVDKLVRVGINTTAPQYELDVEGQIRTTTSIISDTAKINNLDIDTIVNAKLNLKAPVLQSFVDPETGDTFFPTSETPAFDDDTNKVATTNFVYNIATNDVGGRVYVSEQIGNDDFDGRSATKPVRTIKRGAQIAGETPEKETLIVAGGDYLEDNPISIPDKCSVVGDNIRLCIIRPQNPNKHMFKNQNENYMIGVTFRDKIEVVDGFEQAIGTWDYAYVFDDKQRMYYDKTLGGQFGRQFPIGYQIFGEGIFRIEFDRASISDPDFEIGDEIVGVATGGRALITEISYGLPDSLNVSEQTSVDKGSITVNTVRGALEQGDTFKYSPVPAVGAVRWTPETAYTLGQQVFTDNTLYDVSIAGTSGLNEPSHQSGADTNGTLEFSFNTSIPQYIFTASNVKSLRPEGEVTQHVTTHPNYLIESCWFDSADPDWMYFRTQQYHTFEKGQWVEFTDLPNSGAGGDLNRFNGRQYITKRVEQLDGFSDTFAVFKDTPSQLGTESSQFSLTVFGAVVTSSDDYVKFSLLNSPFKFEESEKVGHRFLDGADLIRRNKEFIADEALIRTKEKYTGLVIPDETQCKTDIKHLLNAVQYDLSHGGNAATLEAANYYKEGNALLHISPQLEETRYAFEQAREMAVLAIRNRIKYLSGSNLTAITNTLGGNINSVQWINTQFIAVGDGGLLATSPDGQTWTTQTNPISGATYKDIVWNGTTTIVIGGASGAGVVITSNNGTNWAVAESSLGSATIETIAWDDNEQWVGFGGTQWFTSNNGQEWTANGSFVPVNGSGSHSIVDVIWDYTNSQFVSVGSGGSVYTSPDGTTWTERTTTSTTFSAITSNEDVLIAAAGDEIFKSTDGINWEIGIAAPLVADRYADAADLILANQEIIAEIAVNKMLANNTGFNIPTGNQACKDDVIDFLKSMVIDLQYGGNDQTYDAANLYVTGSHVQGEEDESVEVFGYAETLAISAMRNEEFSVSDIQNYASGLLQNFDNSITIDNNSPYCANVASAISTLFGILTTAIGTTATPGNLSGVTRTPSGSNNNKLYHDGYQFWISSDDGILYSYDGRKWGLTAGTAGLNFSTLGSSYDAFVAFETATNKFYYSTELVNDGTSTEETFRDTTISNTYEANRDYVCANVQSAIYTYFGIIDTVISGGTAPDRILPEKSFTDNGTKFVTFARNFLDLPIIEASPYIFNSSVISFLGGSGCEIDGAKVADPNVIRPGLPPQGKSMVAAAFTIVSFGGTGYRVINDGYTQLVSVFCIFTFDGCIVESGGYASLTNSASNFGIYSLRASGFRSTAYTFDIGVVDDVTFDLIGTPTFDIVQLNSEPREHYIFKIDGIKSVVKASENPEYFIDAVLQASGSEALVQADQQMFLIGNENRYTDAAVLIENNKKYIAEEAFYTELYQNTYSFQANYAKCIRDTELIVQAIADDIRDDGNAFTWDAAKAYIENSGVAHITGYTAASKAVFDEAIILCKKAINNQLLEFGTTPTTEQTNAYYHVAQYTTVKPYVDTTVIHDVSSPANSTGLPTDLYSSSDCANVQTAIDTLNTLLDEILDNPSATTPMPSGAARNDGQFTLDNSTRYKVLNHPINLHRPSICNSSSHTWEFSGSGIDYNALPQNGGKRGSEDTKDFEQVSQNNGRVYASGTDELGNFKVGYFANIENRTGNITFGGTVEIEEVAFLKIKGGDLEIVGFSGDEKLGDVTLGSTEQRSDRILVTQSSIREYITNNYGNYKNKPYGTTPSPGNLVQLGSDGRINIDQIPALRPFNVFTVADLAARLALEGALAGDIAIQLAPNNISYILNNDTYSQILEFTPDTSHTFSALDIVSGTPTNAQGTVSSYIHGEVSPLVNIISSGTGYTTAPTVTIGIQYENSTGYSSGAQVAANGYLYTVTASGTTSASGTGPNHTTGSATDGTVTFEYVGVSAQATASIDSTRVSGVEIITRGSGYTSVPSITFDNTGTGGSGVNVTGSIRSRLEVVLIGNIKFASQDTIEDFSGTPHSVTVSNVVNTSAQLETNWVQLTSTNIDAGSITSGVINPGRLANITSNYPANSNTYLRGDSTFVPVVSSLRVNNSDTPIIINSSNQRGSYIDSIEIVDGGENYAISGFGSGIGTLQSQIVSGGNGEGFLADFTVSNGAVKSIAVTNGGSGYRLVIDENVTPVQFAEEPPTVIFRDSNGNVVVNVVAKAITTNGVVTEIRIIDGGSGFTVAPTIEFTGVGNSAAATSSIADGVISRIAVVEGGLNFTADFTINPLPAAITNPGGDDDLDAEAKLATVSKIFNDITIEIKRGDNLTIAGDDFSNLGVWRFYKEQWDFGPDGALTLKEGPGSGLNADLLDNQEKEFYTNADNIDQGTLGVDFLSGEYNIGITGQSGTTLNLSISDVRQQTLAPSNAPLGTGGAWKKNSDDGLLDGGTDHTKYTSRRGIGTGTTFDGYAITQFAYTDNNNQWIRGSGGNFVGSIAISQSGNGYTPGQYKSVPLGGGEGYGLEADITVGSNGKITDVVISNTGYGYNESDNAPQTFTCVLPQNIFGIDNGRQYDSGYIQWSAGANYNIGDKVFVAQTIGFGRLYNVVTPGTAGTQEPTHSSGSAQATSGTAVLDFAGSLAAELTATLATVNANQWSSWYKLWSSGNDSNSSGLNATFLKGKSETYLQSATNTNFGYLSNRRISDNLAPKSITDSLKVTRFNPQVQINNGVIYEFTVDNILFTYEDLQMLDTGSSSANLNGDTFFSVNLYTETNVNQGTVNVINVTPIYEAQYVWSFGFSAVPDAVDFDPETVYQQGDLVYVIIAGTLGEDVYLYEVTVAGESGTTSLNHTSGSLYNGTAEFKFVSNGIPPSRELQYNNNIYETDEFIRTPTIYNNNLVLGVGTLIIANQNLYEVTTAGTTSASGNGPSHTIGAATDGSVGLTYISARPNIIPIHGPDDGSVSGVTWVRASQLSHTKVQAELISGILNQTVVKFGTAVEPATYYPISDFGITSLDTYSIDKHKLYADGSGNPVISLGNESESTSGQIRFFTSGNAFTLANGDPNLNGYDARIISSGGTSTVGTGTINLQANAAQVNGNNIWHAGNITFANGIDTVNAAYDSQANSQGVIRDSNGDIGFRNAYGDLIGIASENLPLSGGTLTGQLKQEVTDSTAWTPVDNSTIYRYTPYPHELAVINTEAGNASAFSSLFLQAGRASDGARYSSARITAVKSGDYRADLVFGVRDTDFYERVRIRYNGNVGIGVTAANISSALTVNATGGSGWNTNSNTAGILFKNFDVDGGYPSFLTLDNAFDRDIGIGLARQGNTKWVLFNDGTSSPNDIFRITNLQGDYVFSMYQRSDAADVTTSRVGMYTGTSVPTHTLTVNGTFSAKSKSFLIDHPTKENYKLQHGSLEGPEHGVYVRGRVTDGVITLPDYWLALVDEDTITVQLTGIGDSGNRWVVDVADNTVTTGGGAAFYFVQAERKDVPKMEVEMEVQK